MQNNNVKCKINNYTEIAEIKKFSLISTISSNFEF